MKRFLLTIILTIIVLPTNAHHGFRGTYANNTAYWLEGEIMAGHYGLPHTELEIKLSHRKPMETADGMLETLDDYANQFISKLQGPPSGISKVVEVEFPEQRHFFDLENTLKVGDRIVIIAYRGCEKPRPFRGQWILMPDGTHVNVSKISQKEVKTCAASSNRD